jgi:hypothetical protein
MASLEFVGGFTQSLVDRPLAATRRLNPWLRFPAVTLVIFLWIAGLLAASLLLAALVTIVVAVLAQMV